MRQAVRKNQSRFSLTPTMSHRLHEGLLLILCAVSLFILVSLVSYTRTDPGWTNITTVPKVVNWGGRAGAWLADFLYLLFGYVAYILPVMLFYWGCRGFSSQLPRNNVDRMLKGLGLICLLVSACGIVHGYWRHYGVFFPARAGGIVGYLVSRGLMHFFNPIGSLLLLFTFFSCSLTLATGFSWLATVDAIGAGVRLAAVYLWRVLREQWTAKWKAQLGFDKSPAKKSNSMSRMLEWGDKDSKNNEVDTKYKPAPEQEKLPRKVAKPILKLVERLTEKKDKPVSRVFESQNQKIGSAVTLKQGTLPPLSLLNSPVPLAEKPFSQIRFEELSQLVEQRLLDFGVEVKVVGVYPGPVITRFELDLAPGIKVSKITGLAKDIARSLSVASVRVVEVIPGKSVIGLEIANENREVVALQEILGSSQFSQLNSPVCLALGKDIAGVPIVVDLARMPHLLVAGTTGSGKSVSLNAMLLSMLYKATPAELRFILIDPKMLELSIYEGIPHLLTPVITDMKDATNALRWCVIEMDKRYRLMSSLGVRNLAGYNLKITEAIKAGSPIPAPEWLVAKAGEPVQLEPLPLIVVVADELADMMMVVGKKVEELVVRLAQKARAAGIHLILATQRPSVDVITGLIKANVPTRIAFQVPTRIDSRTILDQQGAEQLLGYGDMLYLPAGAGIPIRVHGAYVSDEEVHRVVAAWQTYSKPEYLTSITEDDAESGEGEQGAPGESDPLYDQAVRVVTESRRASISLIQRRLRIGYNRAARMMEDMEAAGLVSSDNGGSREVLAAPPPLL